MKILVLVKQIPEISKIQFDPATNRIKREEVPLIINPFDKRAVEEAIRIKEKRGAEVVVATLGPPSAAEVLNASLRMGADRAILISDPGFAGSDTLITSRVLSLVVGKIEPDLILLGKYSLDGETSQVPPEVALFSGYAFRTSISRIEFEDGGKMIVEQDEDDGSTDYEIALPALLSVSEKINRARFVPPSVPDMTSRIEKWSASDLSTLIKGSDSPTVVESTVRIESKRSVEYMDRLDTILDMVRSISSSGENRGIDRITIGDAIPGGRHALVVAAGDKRTAFELSAKMCNLGKGKFNTVLLGSFSPAEVEGLACHSYLHLKNGSNLAISDYIADYIKREKPEFVVFPSNIAGREISAFVAAKLSLGLTADCIDLAVENGKLIQYKPAFGGGMVARITSRTKPEMATVRPGMFPFSIAESHFSVHDIDLTGKFEDKVVASRKIPDTFRRLQGSRIIIGLGKGIGSKENVGEVVKFADRIGAAVGGTRPIVDLGWLPRQQQIGLTGYSISPDLYIAIGIGGHDNHVVGTRYAGKIVAVNRDRNAPIFNYSDFGLIEDSMEFVRKFSDLLESN